MRRVIVIGPPGSGKSTFAQKLSERTGLPLIHLDMIWFLPDGSHIKSELFDSRVSALTTGTQWIMDGNYPPSLERRIIQCDTVFLMDIPPDECADGIRQRRGRHQNSRPFVEGRESEELVKKTLEFRSTSMERLYALLRRYRGCREVITFHSRREADEYLEKL